MRSIAEATDCVADEGSPFGLLERTAIVSRHRQKEILRSAQIAFLRMTTLELPDGLDQGEDAHGRPAHLSSFRLWLSS
jgi:hypothetical protein